MILRTAATTMLLFAGPLFLRAAAAQQPEPQPRIEYLSSAETRAAGLPFSEAVRVGDLIYVSGMLGTRPGTLELAPGGIREETRQALENIRDIVERAGSSMERVVKCTAMLADMAEWPAMNEVYVTFFPADRRPARSAFGATALALGARVEIECIAAASRDAP